MYALESIAEGVWASEHDLFMPGGIHFRGRMTVVRLGDGSLLLHSPIPIDDGLAEQLAAHGPVAHIVAPSRLHHLHVAGVSARYPEARVWAAPGLPEKRPDLAFHGVITRDPVPWADDFEPLFVAGIPWMNEVVFLHRASRTAVVTDLFFAIHEVANLQSRLFFGAYGVLGRVKQSPVVWLMTRDRPAYAASIDRFFEWGFDRVVPAHGIVVEDDVHERVGRALGRG